MTAVRRDLPPGLDAGLSSDTAVTFSWQVNQIPGHLFYSVYREVQATEGNPPTVIGTTPNTTFTDSDPPAGPAVILGDLELHLQLGADHSTHACRHCRGITVYTERGVESGIGPRHCSIHVREPALPGLGESGIRLSGIVPAGGPLVSRPRILAEVLRGTDGRRGGAALPAVSVALQTGWNLIGSIGVPVEAASVGSIPPGLVVSQFFVYSPQSGYASADTIHPWRGYWVKAADSGQLGAQFLPVAGRKNQDRPHRGTPAGTSR